MILYVAYSLGNLFPKRLGNLCIGDYAMNAFQNRSTFTFSKTILEWRISSSKMTLDTLRFVKCYECIRGVLATSVTTNTLNFPSWGFS
jgi:hypothetical protein